jgi:Ca2+-binding EF-hand superfamily protein
MQKRYLWLGLTAALMIAFAATDGTDAQVGKKGPFGKGDFPRSITADQIVEHIMSYDKNSDGKITIDELPERMQHLIALGDVNKDGTLDKDEIRKLATTLESFAGLTGNNPGKGPPAGAKGFPGKGGAGKGKGAAAEVQRTLDELNVSGSARDKADRAIRAHQDKVRRFEELARAELLMQIDQLQKELEELRRKVQK